MPRHARRLSESGIYHVMLRGVNRDALFLEDEDHERFLHCLGLVRDASACRVLAYCLMTNHVHLILRTAEEPIGTVVKRLGVRYAGWFNRKYGRVGHLFQDRFISLPVEDDAYLVTLLRYVWHNPVAAGLSERPEHYRWSSRRLFRRESPLLDGESLDQLLPSGPLADILTVPPPVAGDVAERLGRPPRHSDEDVAELLRRSCGARGPEEFGRLDASTRRRAICELRTRSVPYAQISRVTGLSTSGVRRAHIAGFPSVDGLATDSADAQSALG